MCQAHINKTIIQRQNCCRLRMAEGIFMNYGVRKSCPFDKIIYVTINYVTKEGRNKI